MAEGYNLIELDGQIVFKMLPLIHEKKDFCGGDGCLGNTIDGKIGLKLAKIAKIWPKNGLKWPKIA